MVRQVTAERPRDGAGTRPADAPTGARGRGHASLTIAPPWSRRYSGSTGRHWAIRRYASRPPRQTGPFYADAPRSRAKGVPTCTGVATPCVPAPGGGNHRIETMTAQRYSMGTSSPPQTASDRHLEAMTSVDVGSSATQESMVERPRSLGPTRPSFRTPFVALSTSVSARDGVSRRQPRCHRVLEVLRYTRDGPQCRRRSKYVCRGREPTGAKSFRASLLVTTAL